MTDTKRCRGTNAAGEPCKSPVVGEDGFCPAHREGGRQEMKRRALAGAVASQEGRGLDRGELPRLDGPQTAALWLDRIGRATATGRLGHREARAVIAAVEAFLKAHEAGQMADQVDELKAALATWKETGDASAVLEVVK